MATAATVEVILPRLHPAQWQIARSTARFRVAVCARRFGKTLEGSGEAVITASEGGRVWWVAPSYVVSRRGWEAVSHITHQIPGVQVRKSDREIYLPGGGFIGFKTSDSKSGLLGDGLDLIIVDEAGVVPEIAWTRDLRAALSDRMGRALFLGTPRGRNWFWAAYMRGQNRERWPEWESWRFPTSANPHIRQSEIDSARDLLPQRIFQQEYEAEFLDDGGAVFRNLAACTTGAQDKTRRDGIRYVFGVDWGRSNDYTCIAVMDATNKRLVYIERFVDIGWSLQRGRLAALAARFEPEAIWAEANSIGGPNIEALQAEGLPVIAFTTTAQSKGPLIESLALAFENEEIAIYNDPILYDELSAYTLTRLPSGRFQYSAPPGGHDDTVIATALSWWGSMHSGSFISYAT